jgi:mono/diheme cytochrome c family protein
MSRLVVPSGVVASTTCALSLILSPVAGAAEANVKIERLWKAKCSSCHGVDGKAQTDSGKKLQIPDMTSAAWQKLTTTDEVKKAINEGIKREGKEESMPVFKDKLTPEQIDQLSAYVRALGK